jgi:hypothetical protein
MRSRNAPDAPVLSSATERSEEKEDNSTRQWGPKEERQCVTSESAKMDSLDSTG